MTRAEMVRRYAAGENLRQIGDAAGRSHEAVRLNLLAEGVALRPRCSGTPRTPRISTLADEIAEDLGRWPEGASMSDLREWLGGSQKETANAVRALFACGLVRIVPA